MRGEALDDPGDRHPRIRVPGLRPTARGESGRAHPEERDEVSLCRAARRSALCRGDRLSRGWRR